MVPLMRQDIDDIASVVRLIDECLESFVYTSVQP